MRPNSMRGVAPITVVAALSIAVLLSAIGIRAGTLVRARTYTPPPQAPVELPEYHDEPDNDNNGIPDWQDELMSAGVLVATSSPDDPTLADPLSHMAEDVTSAIMNGYASLKLTNQYTPERGKELGTTIAAALKAPVTFTLHTKEELQTTEDGSVERILRYRGDMRSATEPLVTNDNPEFYYYAKFVETGDPFWLTELTRIAQNYREAEKRMLAVIVPTSAADYHVRAINATGKFAETLDRLVQFSSDPVAQLALIRTYNEVEREMLLAFDALGRFYARAAVGN